MIDLAPKTVVPDRWPKRGGLVLKLPPWRPLRQAGRCRHQVSGLDRTVRPSRITARREEPHATRIDHAGVEVGHPTARAMVVE